MLTGDFDNEEELVAKELDLAADILKVGHHGSGNANDFNFLQAVSPALAIISCGQDNKFNHPSPEVIQQLSQLGIPALITYEKGDIVIKSDGQNLRLEK